MKKAIFALLFGLLFILGYALALKVQIGACSVKSGPSEAKEITLPYRHASSGRKVYEYRCELTPSFFKHIRIGIGADDQLLNVSLNGTPLDLTLFRTEYRQKKFENWEQGYPFDVTLNEGVNELKIQARDYGFFYGLSIAQSMEFWDFVVLFFFGAVPVLYALFVLLFIPIISVRSFASFPKTFLLNAIVPLLLFTAVIVRFFYVEYIGNNSYQHDMHEHMLAIQYYAEHPWRMPQPDKLGEAPQQPLYYWISGAIYKQAKSAGLNEREAVYWLRKASLVYMMLWLTLSYLLIRRLSADRSVQALFVIFVGFTPSFVYLAGGVNNDVLNALWGAAVFYAAARYWQEGKTRWLTLAAAATLLAMMTKISSVLLVVFLAVLLIVRYRQAQSEHSRLQLRRQLLGYGLAVALVFGFALWKVYIPVSHEFRFVNGGLFGGQVVPVLDMGFFFSFRLGELLHEGQAYVMGNDEVRFSLPTYLYGTLFFGEFDFANYFGKGSLFKLAAQMVYLFGLLYLVAIVVFLSGWRQRDTFTKMIAVAVALNLLLVLRHVLGNWNVCNYDFRFFTPTLAALGVMIALGAERFMHYAWLKKAVLVSGGVLLIAQTAWISELIVRY